MDPEGLPLLELCTYGNISCALFEHKRALVVVVVEVLRRPAAPNVSGRQPAVSCAARDRQCNFVFGQHTGRQAREEFLIDELGGVVHKLWRVSILPRPLTELIAYCQHPPR
eukprot:scaffold133270_cov93-Phaeocystis_antarctica.AAC.2